MADYSAEIAAIETILNSGATSISVDGLSTSYNFDQLRKRLAELKALDDSTIANGNVRPKRATIKLRYY
jgi:hypothetical protein